MAFYGVPSVLIGDSLSFHGNHSACTALSRHSHWADSVLKTFVCITQQDRHETMKVAMLKPSSFLQPWPDPKHSTRLGLPPLSSSENDVNSVYSILELVDLYIGKQESSMLPYVGHSEMNAQLHMSFL